LEDLIVRLKIEKDNQKFEKRSNKNSYEAKANVIEDSKGKASTFNDLKWKKIARRYKGEDQEGKKRFKGTCYICNKERHKANEYHSRPKKNKDQPHTNMIDHASPSQSAVVSEVNLTTKNKDW